MNRFFPASEEEIVLSAASQLLVGFKSMYPSVVTETVEAVKKGQYLEQAGRILAAAVQSTQDKLQQDASEKIGTLQETVGGLKKQLAETEHKIAQISSQNQQFQRICDAQTDELEELRETITIQNRILARQQQKLQNLLGNSLDDE